MGNQQDYGHDIGLNIDTFDPKLVNKSSLPFNIRCIDYDQYHDNWVTCVASLGDYIISGSKDCMIRIYSTVLSSKIVKKQRPTFNRNEKFKGNRFLFVREQKKRLKLELEMKVPYRSTFYINHIVPITDRYFLTSSSSFYENVILWKLEITLTDNIKPQNVLQMKKIKSFTHLLSCTSLCILSNRDCIFAGGSHKEICLWNWNSGHLIRKMNDHQGYVLALTKCQNPRYDHLLISAGGRFKNDYRIRVWNWKTGELLRIMFPFDGHKDDVNVLSSVVHPRSGKEIILSGGKDGVICAWDVERCVLEAKYVCGGGGVQNKSIGSSLSPEITNLLVYNHEYFISSGLDRKLRLWKNECVYEDDDHIDDPKKNQKRRRRRRNNKKVVMVKSCVMIVTEFHQSWNSLSSCWLDDVKKEYFVTGCDGSVFNRVRLWKFVDKQKEVRWILQKYTEKRRARFSQKYIFRCWEEYNNNNNVENSNPEETSSSEFVRCTQFLINKNGRKILCYKSLLTSSIQ